MILWMQAEAVLACAVRGTMGWPIMQLEVQA